MDGHPPSLSPRELYARVGAASAPVPVDVRVTVDFAASDRLIVGASLSARRRTLLFRYHPTHYDIQDPTLDHLATIVRGPDTSRHDLAPQCGGLFAISLGLSANFPDDHEMLKHGIVIYDALFTWCRSLQAETHNWPSTKAVQQAAP